MNKKAFLLGESTIFFYSIVFLLSLGVLSYAFSFATNLQGAKSQEKAFEVIAVNTDIRTYETLKYYLDTKINVNDKKTTIRSAIPLYCYTKNQKILDEIRKETENLPIYFYSIDIYCTKEEEQCDKKTLITLTPDNVVNRISSNQQLIVDMPELEPKSHVCLAIS